MKKIVVFNLLFCILVIALCNIYYDSKAKEVIVYNYVANQLEKDYEISRKNLNMDIQYHRGTGLYEILVQESEKKKEYFFEVDISDDYSLYYLKDLSSIHNRKDNN